MPHIPPDQPVLPTDLPPITIKGGEDTIKIKLPPFNKVTTSMSIKLSRDGGVASVHSEAEETAPGGSFQSRITRIELEDVVQDTNESDGLVFKPKKDGECTVKIYFDHP